MATDRYTTDSRKSPRRRRRTWRRRKAVSVGTDVPARGSLAVTDMALTVPTRPEGTIGESYEDLMNVYVKMMVRAPSTNTRFSANHFTA